MGYPPYQKFIMNLSGDEDVCVPCKFLTRCGKKIVQISSPFERVIIINKIKVYIFNIVT